MEFILRVDRKGRILIPSQVRSMLSIKEAVKAYIDGERLIIEAVKDPIENLTSTVLRGTVDVEAEIRELRQLSWKEAVKRVKERWP